MALIERFRAFHDELLRVEREVAARQLTPDQARVTLRRFLERQQVAAEREGGTFAAELFVRAKYAMVALADEHFLRPGSPARAAWLDELLESEMFKSQWAGEKLFEDIDELQNDRHAEELAHVYLAVLGLGFEGKYHGVEGGEDELERYRRKLYCLIYGHEPRGYEVDGQMLPEAYASTLSGSDATELPYLRPWVITLAILIVLWLGIGHWIWRRSVFKLEPFVDEVIEAAALLGSVIG